MNGRDDRRRTIARILEDGRLEGLFPLDGSPPAMQESLDRLPAPPGSVLEGWLHEGDLRIRGPFDVLAEGESPAARLYELMARHGVDPLYPPEAEEELAAFLARPGIDDPSLVDLEDLPFVTIDNPDSRDLDQALHVEPWGDGGTKLRYALADASHFAPPDSALFEEALRRGVTIYLPRLTVPLLPPALSEGLTSLNPDVSRRALVMELDLDETGRCRRRQLFRGRIRSRAKLSYGQVQAFHDDPANSDLNHRPFTETLVLMARIGRLRMAEARQRHVVRYDRRQQEVHLDASSPCGFVLREEERHAVDEWNEQISLLCNAEGAALLEEGLDDPNLQAIFRVHEAPDRASLGHVRRVLETLTRLHGLDRKLWTWNGRSPLADYLDALPRDAAFAPLRATVQRQILLSNRRASFSALPGRHHGLAMESYVRFTAPMREVVGIFTHKEALELLGLVPPRPAAEDENLRRRVIEAAHRGQERQRRIDKALVQMAVDGFLREDVLAPLPQRPRHRGIVLGLKDQRAYVRLDDPPVDLKLPVAHLEELAGEAVRIDAEGGMLLRGTPPRPWLRMGDEIRLVTAGREKETGKWLLAPEELVGRAVGTR